MSEKHGCFSSGMEWGVCCFPGKFNSICFPVHLPLLFVSSSSSIISSYSLSFSIPSSYFYSVPPFLLFLLQRILVLLSMCESGLCIWERMVITRCKWKLTYCINGQQYLQGSSKVVTRLNQPPPLCGCVQYWSTNKRDRAWLIDCFHPLLGMLYRGHKHDIWRQVLWRGKGAGLVLAGVGNPNMAIWESWLFLGFLRVFIIYVTLLTHP